MNRYYVRLKWLIGIEQISNEDACFVHVNINLYVCLDDH